MIKPDIEWISILIYDNCDNWIVCVFFVGRACFYHVFMRLMCEKSVTQRKVFFYEILIIWHHYFISQCIFAWKKKNNNNNNTIRFMRNVLLVAFPIFFPVSYFCLLTNTTNDCINEHVEFLLLFSISIRSLFDTCMTIYILNWYLM